MKLNQITKILRIMVIAVFLMFLFDFIFQFDSVTEPIAEWIKSLQGESHEWMLWAGIWFIMFIQVAVIPIPAIVILQAALSIGILQNNLSMFSTWDFWLFIIVVASAYLVGALAAYWLGYKFGRKATRWCAGSDEEYEKWATFLSKKGKYFYAATILLPVFPDDLLCLIAGSLKFDIGFFTASNLICRTIGLLTMMGVLGALGSLSGGGYFSTILWGVLFIVLLTISILLERKERREKIKERLNIK